MTDQYILDGKQPVLEPDLIKWGEWLQKANRHVADTTIGDSRVSTVFLGMNHAWGRPDQPPVLFETMVFGGPLNQEMERYGKWDEAEEGHAAMCERVRTAAAELDRQEGKS